MSDSWVDIKSGFHVATRLLLECRDSVGESNVCGDRRNALVWVDIGGRRIHRLCLSNDKHEARQILEFPTSIGLRQDGGAIVGLRSRVALWDFGGAFHMLAIPEPDLPDNRLNEGRVAPDVSFTDTMQNTIFSFALRDGLLAARSVFHGPLDRDYPDGSCLDRQGRLWNCRVAGGSAIARVSPDGAFEDYVELPCSWPTSCTFGSPRLDRLYVTSARFTMSADHLALRPLEGCRFEFDVNSVDITEPRFG